MPDAASTTPPIDRRRLAIVAVVWIVVVAAVLGLAAALTDTPRPAERASTPSPDLPPLRLTLDRDLPASVRATTSIDAQIAELQRLAMEGNTPASWVELGAARHFAEDYSGAVLDYRRALALDSTRLDAQVGLLMVDAATESGRARSAEALAKLAAANPGSQIVAFNQGMVAVYRRDTQTARAAFTAVRQINPSNQLGKLASGLLTAVSGKKSP